MPWRRIEQGRLIESGGGVDIATYKLERSGKPSLNKPVRAEPCEYPEVYLNMICRDGKKVSITEQLEAEPEEGVNGRYTHDHSRILA